MVKQFISDTDRKFNLIFAFFSGYECSLAGTSIFAIVHDLVLCSIFIVF